MVTQVLNCMVVARSTTGLQRRRGSLGARRSRMVPPGGGVLRTDDLDGEGGENDSTSTGMA